MPVFFCTRRISDGNLYGEKMKTILPILLWIWQAPQNLVGLALRFWYRRRIISEHRFRGVPYFVVSKMPGGGISLGRTVIIRNNPFGIDWDAWNHEYGHTRQSIYLGPLYLLIIGIPSVLWLLYHRIDRRRSYYWFYTEKWADRLGGVTRFEK